MVQQIVNDNALINGMRVATGRHGDGHPVVLIHGTPSSSLIWRKVVPRLTDVGYHVHLYDLLGYGCSERPWDPAIDTSVSGQVPILEALLDHWNLESAHIVAHDIGGGIAQRLAVFSPTRLRSLTLIDVVSFDSWPSKLTREQMQRGPDALAKASEADHRAHFREWLLSAVQNKDSLAETVLDTYLDFISNPIGQGSLFQHQVRHYDPKHTEELAPRIAEIGRIPVQIIWGADDCWQVIDWAHRLHAAIPGSELHVVRNCGHFAMEDQPEKISKLVVGFLKQHDSG